MTSRLGPFAPSPPKLALPKLAPLALALGLVAVGCSSATDQAAEESGTEEPSEAASESTAETTDGGADTTDAEVQPGVALEFGPAPAVPDGPTDAAAAQQLSQIVLTLTDTEADAETQAERIGAGLEVIEATEDPRFAWALADILRFTQGSAVGERVIESMTVLTGTSFDGALSPWGDSVNSLIAWDQPAHDDYPAFKASFFGAIDERWEPLFEGGDDNIDLRHVSWGGVFIDDRPLGTASGCARGCIPALDDPTVTPAEGGDWYPDEAIVFGVVINGEARAYPKNQMEVHEMVNDTLGGRRIAIPYCTLCGSAQAYLTDELGDDFEEPVLRTSGLLIRSNKMMYELNTGSFVDTFLGQATSGPLAEAGVEFNQVSVVRSTWADWREAHPDTTIIAEDGGIGRSYEADPLDGRDDDGPIFPIGDVDPRLAVQESVLGVTGASGVPVAFHVGAARQALLDGETVTFDEVELRLDGSGVRALDADGNEIESHEAFWFAWSQFQPETLVWPLDA